MDKKQITVLVTVFNKKETIKDCIDSLLNLNYLPVRIMVLDGGSTDGTCQILEEYNDKIDLFQLKIGHSNRFNWAFDRVKDELIAMTDADCVVAPDWLDKLVKGFNQNNIIATAGFCGTPKGLSFFQTIVGLELENRFKRFPKYITRAPTMNLCLKTDLARKVRFDEKQLVDIEADFCWRLTKLGKMLYIPEAKVFHYHRSSFKGFFKQQKDYAKWGLRLLTKHGHSAAADQITTLSMSIQIPILSLAILFLALSFWNNLFLYSSLFFFSILLIIYFKNIFEIKPPLSYYPAFLGLFIFRTIAWIYGIIEGIPILIKELIKKS